MRREVAAARLTALAAVVTVALLLAPYAVADATAVAVYYGQGPLSALYAGVFVAVAAIAVGGARRGTTDPATAAGWAVAFALGAAILGTAWAFAVSADVVGGLTDVAAVEHHRWVLLLAVLVHLGAVGVFAADATGVEAKGP